MKITVNGRETEIEPSQTIYSYLKYKDINPASVIVEYNYEIPDRAKWPEIELKEGDNLEIVKFIGGG